MKNIFIKAAFAVVIALPVQADTITNTFSSYYSFGDSLTDDGKFGALPAPSLGGRFSNGPTYAEYVADVFIAEGLDTGNLALGGATAGDTNLNPFGPLSTFGGQIGTFVAALSGAFNLPTSVDFSTTQPNAPAPGANPLVSVLFGGNDFFQGFDMVEAANSVADGIRLIAALTGNLFNDFLVMDLPDIGGSPAYAFSGAAAATAASDTFNEQLASNVLELRAEGLNIISFNSSDPFDLILADIEAGGGMFGITNGRDACTASLAEPGPSCLDFGIDPDTLAFADGVHPSGAVHRVLGAAVLAELNASVSPVPLPATLPLLLAGLFGFGVLRRKRLA